MAARIRHASDPRRDLDHMTGGMFIAGSVFWSIVALPFVLGAVIGHTLVSWVRRGRI
jgi:hypothetical protein